MTKAPTPTELEWGNNDIWNTRTRGTLLQRSTLQPGINVDNKRKKKRSDSVIWQKTLHRQDSNEVIMTLETSGSGEPILCLKTTDPLENILGVRFSGESATYVQHCHVKPQLRGDIKRFPGLFYSSCERRRLFYLPSNMKAERIIM